MWEDRGGKKVMRVNEVDVLVGVVIGLAGSKACTKQRLRKAAFWMTPLQLQLVLARCIQRGLLKEVGNKYYIITEEAFTNEGKPRHSGQLPPPKRILHDVHDIYATNFTM